MTGVRERTRTLLDKVRFDIRGEAHWVEPGNWITRAILSGELEPRPKFELAPDNVVLAAPAPRPAADDAAVARAG
jgi:hypothetical protein